MTIDQLRALMQSERMIVAGEAYYREGRVSNLEYDRDLDMVTAIVRGSGQNRYFSSIMFPDEDAELPIDSECSCPVEYGCKHVAAVFFALRDATPAKPSLQITVESAGRTQIDGPVRDWLASVQIEDLESSLLREEVLFVVEPKRAGKVEKKSKSKTGASSEAPARYLFQIRAWRRQSRKAAWRVFQSYELQYPHGALDPVALRLFARMAPSHQGGDFNANKTPAGRQGWQWLCEAVSAGLLTWKNPEGPAIVIAPDNLQSPFAWRVLEDGRHVLDLTDTQGFQIFAGDPPLFFDEKTSAIGLVDAGLDPPMTGRLLAMPPVAPAELPALAEQWPMIAGDHLPPPTISEHGELTSTAPRPVLRFLTDKVERRVADNYWYRERFRQSPLEVARVEFDYGGHRVTAHDTGAQVIRRAEQGLVRLVRDISAEQAAVDRLASTPLFPMYHLEHCRAKPHQLWDHVLVSDIFEPDIETDYRAFLINETAQLVEEGWLIEFASGWKQVFRPLQTDEISLEIAPAKGPDGAPGGADIDWFDIALPALIDRQRLDILPVLRQILATPDQDVLARSDDYKLVVPLGEGRFTALRLGTVRPLLQALLSLALADHTPGRLKVNRFDVGIVHDLFGNGQNWTQENALRRLACTLHEPDSTDFTPPPGLRAELRLYQRTGTFWLGALHDAGLGGILADDMGLGKTLQAITHILQVRCREAAKDKGPPRPVLIVAPTSVLPNWEAELKRFAPDLACLMWHGLERRKLSGDLDSSGVILTSYALLARDIRELSKIAFAVVVLDEAHMLKNPATAGFKAAAALTSVQVIAMSGTPIENRLNDLWALSTLTNPGLLGSFETFRKTYRTPIEKQGDMAAQTALIRRIRPFVLRRAKDEVAAELPPKTIIPERIDLTDAQMRLYESQRLLMHQRIRDEIDRVGIMRSQIVVLDAMLKLRQICCDPGLLPGGLGEGVPSAKRQRLGEMLPELLGEGRRVIIFSQFTTMLDRIAADLDISGIVYEQLRGTTKNRARPIERFQNGDVAIILVSLKAGGAGINLTAADTVILYDPWWNPAVEAQAIDRAHRIGQTKPVFVHRMIAINSIEEKILALQERKQGFADMLWSGQVAAGGTGLDDEDIAFLLG